MEKGVICIWYCEIASNKINNVILDLGALMTSDDAKHIGEENFGTQRFDKNMNIVFLAAMRRELDEQSHATVKSLRKIKQWDFRLRT